MTRDASHLHTPEALAKRLEGAKKAKASLPFHPGDCVRAKASVVETWMGSVDVSELGKLTVVASDRLNVEVQAKSGKLCHFVPGSLELVESAAVVEGVRAHKEIEGEGEPRVELGPTYGDAHGHPGCHGCQICFGNDPVIQEMMADPDLGKGDPRVDADARKAPASDDDEEFFDEEDVED